MNILKQFWTFLRENKKWWLLPIFISLLILGALLFFTSGPALAPFLYKQF
ncbi:MAG TPA: DUF5989 family protein [Verrucomicrobiae bacterium]|nr:DUF5989 family protein [Verrucomicrobiae bacterium]